MTEQEEELKTSLAKEKELSELKSRFVSMASHEFRTPLSTIMSSASLISRYTESDQNEKRIKHVERIKSAVGNLTGILNDFLSLSKLEEGKVGLNIEDLNMSDMCRIVNEDLEGLLKKGQRINHKSIGEFRILKTDKRILKNVLFNIVSNAVKYSGEGDLIECRVQYGNEDLEISIVDEGIGIPENEQKHLFDRFFRASNVETIQGTGLGLNIVKQYVKLLKGSISFKSIPQKGTTFTIRLPYRYEENTGHRG
jgi:signal transduction histidine kinase